MFELPRLTQEEQLKIFKYAYNISKNVKDKDRIYTLATLYIFIAWLKDFLQNAYIREQDEIYNQWNIKQFIKY